MKVEDCGIVTVEVPAIIELKPVTASAAKAIIRTRKTAFRLI